MTPTRSRAPSKRKILITGGAGYIGSLANKLLSDNGYETVVLDNLSCGQREMIVRGTFVEGDFGDEILLDELLSSGIDAVLHFAALTSVGDSVKDPITYYETNTAKTLTLIKKILEHKIQRFVFSSTAAVYGIPAQPAPIKENAALSPINPYGSSKMMVEKILSEVCAASNLKYIALRYFNAAGGDPDGEISTRKLVKSNLIPLLMHHTANPATPFIINGIDYPTADGTCVRDYIHVYDLCTAHMLALEKLLDGCDSAVYNLGNGNGFSVKEVIEAFEKVTGIKIRSTIGPRRPGDPPILLADSTLAKRELGWKPEYPEIEAIIKDAWKCYQPCNI